MNFDTTTELVYTYYLHIICYDYLIENTTCYQSKDTQPLPLQKQKISRPFMLLNVELQQPSTWQRSILHIDLSVGEICL